jgi:type II secretory pathway pseudopilin PulG
MIPAVYRQLQDQKGGALLIVLVMVVIVGLSAGIAGTSWQTIVQRADEAELFWRGSQYRQAIQSYYEYGSGSSRNKTGQYPAKLDDLLKDPRSLASKKHIRQLYVDPVTDGDWELVKDKTGRIIGVRSSSDREPFQQDGFPLGYEDFAGAASYSSWDFSYQPTQKPLATKVKPGNKTSGSSEDP